MDLKIKVLLNVCSFVLNFYHYLAILIFKADV